MENQIDILFQPIPIGPVVAPNRFCQVPLCNGFGYRMPMALAAMRGIKAAVDFDKTPSDATPFRIEYMEVLGACEEDSL